MDPIDIKVESTVDNESDDYSSFYKICPEQTVKSEPIDVPYDDKCDFPRVDSCLQLTKCCDTPSPIKVEHKSENDMLDFFQMIKHEDEQNCEIVSCSVCAKSYPERRQLTRHLLSHCDLKNKVCIICQETFHKLLNLAEHLKCHVQDNTYSCGKHFNHDEFELSFGGNNFDKQLCSSESLAGSFHNSPPTRHTEACRSQSKSRLFHECDRCGKRFSRNCDLTRHKFTHSQTKSFACKICFKSFKANYSLVRHTKIHADKNNPYSCHICEKLFKRKRNLTDHEIMSHSIVGKHFSCDVCYQQFTKKSHFDKHIRIHIK